MHAFCTYIFDKAVACDSWPTCTIYFSMGLTTV